MLSVRVLETRSIASNQIFPDRGIETEFIGDDSIELPRGALIENSEGGLVRIVFVAFDRLETILRPLDAANGEPKSFDELSDAPGKTNDNRHLFTTHMHDHIIRTANTPKAAAQLFHRVRHELCRAALGSLATELGAFMPQAARTHLCRYDGCSKARRFFGVCVRARAMHACCGQKADFRVICSYHFN